METLLKPRRGRPANTVHGTMSGGNPVTGETLAWSDGEWHGTKRLVTEANYLCLTHETLPVPYTGAFVMASAEFPVAAYAVIAALVGTRGRIGGDVPWKEIKAYEEAALMDPDEFQGVA